MDPSLVPDLCWQLWTQGLWHTQVSRCHYVPFSMLEPGFEHTNWVKPSLIMVFNWVSVWVDCEIALCKVPGSQMSTICKVCTCFFAIELPGFAAPYLIFLPDCFFFIQLAMRLCPLDGQMEQWATALGKEMRVKTTHAQNFLGLLFWHTTPLKWKPRDSHSHVEPCFVAHSNKMWLIYPSAGWRQRASCVDLHLHYELDPLTGFSLPHCVLGRATSLKDITSQYMFIVGGLALCCT